jgi:hypothetical protein
MDRCFAYPTINRHNATWHPIISIKKKPFDISSNLSGSFNRKPKGMTLSIASIIPHKTPPSTKKELTDMPNAKQIS